MSLNVLLGIAIVLIAVLILQKCYKQFKKRPNRLVEDEMAFYSQSGSVEMKSSAGYTMKI